MKSVTVNIPEIFNQQRHYKNTSHSKQLQYAAVVKLTKINYTFSI